MFIEKIRISIGNIINNLKSVKPCTLKSVKLAEVKNVLIIANIEAQQDLETVNTFRKDIQKLCPQTKIHSLLFVDKETNQEFAGISDYDKQFISAEDFSFLMKITNEDLQKTLKKEYNIAINLSIRAQTYIDFLFNYVRANLLVGQPNEKIKTLNFIINSKSKTVKELGDDIKKNLRMFF